MKSGLLTPDQPKRDLSYQNLRASSVGGVADGEGRKQQKERFCPFMSYRGREKHNLPSSARNVRGVLK